MGIWVFGTCHLKSCDDKTARLGGPRDHQCQLNIMTVIGTCLLDDQTILIL